MLQTNKLLKQMHEQIAWFPVDITGNFTRNSKKYDAFKEIIDIFFYIQTL